jgi:hypothetical protein
LKDIWKIQSPIINRVQRFDLYFSYINQYNSVLSVLKWLKFPTVSYIYTCSGPVFMAACEPMGTGGWSHELAQNPEDEDRD